MSIQLKGYKNIKGEIVSCHFVDYSIVDKYNCIKCLIYTTDSSIYYSFGAVYNIKTDSNIDLEWTTGKPWITTEKEVNKMIRQMKLSVLKRNLIKDIKLLIFTYFCLQSSIINNLMVMLAFIQVVLSYPFVTIINLIKKNK